MLRFPVTWYFKTACWSPIRPSYEHFASITDYFSENWLLGILYKYLDFLSSNSVYFAAFLQNYISVSLTLDLSSSSNPSYEHFESITDIFSKNWLLGVL